MAIGKCVACGEDDSRVLKEWHHVFSKAVGKETILLCHNCHDKITHDQNAFPPSIRKHNTIAYYLRTQGSLLELIGKKQKELSMKESKK